MSFFDGNGRRTAKVDLRGRSRVESREQVLERTRAEREQRRRLKLETRSATCIQVRGGLGDIACRPCSSLDAGIEIGIRCRGHRPIAFVAEMPNLN